MTRPRAVPRYLQLAEELRRDVRTGKLKPGDQLPSYASLKASTGLSHSTWDKVNALLERERLVVRLPKRGTFVADSRRPNVGVIGVAMGVAPWQHPYYASLLKGIHRATEEAEIEVLLLFRGAAIQWEKVDGVLAVGRALETAGELPPGMDCVSVLAGAPGGPDIAADEAGGVREAIAHLLGLGHRRIGYLGTGVREFETVPNRRLIEYRKLMAAAGIAIEASWVRELRTEEGPVREFDSMGRSAMQRWLGEDWKDHGCTALLTQNDETAIGVIDALQGAGIEVPREVSVVGFDGTEIASYYRPRLTTVKVPLEAIGAAGVARLLQEIAAPLGGSVAADGPRTELLPTMLAPGDSTGPCAGPRR